MNSLFLILFLVCFIALFVGLIRPQIVVRWGDSEKRNRKNVFKYYGIGLIVFFILFGVTSNNTGTSQTNKSTSTSNTSSTKKELTAEEKASAEEIDKKILVLGDVNTLTLDKASVVKSTRNAYNALTSEQKKVVTKLEILAAAEKKIADLQAAADKAAADKAAAEKAAADKVAYDTGITYDQLARTPDTYKDKKVKFTGEVAQVMEGDGETQLRIAVNGDYDKIILVAYKSSITSTRALENDNVTIKGVSKGLYTYKSTIGGNITVPLIFVDIIGINK